MSEHLRGELSHDLTEREMEVVRCRARGLTDQETADELGVARSTVRKHVQHILQRLGARNMTQVVAMLAGQFRT